MPTPGVFYVFGVLFFFFEEKGTEMQPGAADLAVNLGSFNVSIENIAFWLDKHFLF